METIVQKALDGGYKTRDARVAINHELLPEMVIDALFWQALGKACGWPKKDHLIHVNEGKVVHNWLEEALFFHEMNLNEGWDAAIKFLEDQIK